MMEAGSKPTLTGQQKFHSPSGTREGHAISGIYRRTLTFGNFHAIRPRLCEPARLGRSTCFGPPYPYATHPPAGRSRDFPDALVHRAAGTLGAGAFRDERISPDATDGEDPWAGNDYFPARADRRFLPTERVHQIFRSGPGGGAAVLQRDWDFPTDDSCRPSSFGMACGTAADNSLGSLDHQCFQPD